jgi:hypothetical protein
MPGIIDFHQVLDAQGTDCLQKLRFQTFFEGGLLSFSAYI